MTLEEKIVAVVVEWEAGVVAQAVGCPVVLRLGAQQACLSLNS